MTYLMAYYVYFNQQKDTEIFGQRVRNFISFEMEIEADKEQYYKMASTLMAWIKATIITLDQRNFPNSLPGVGKCMLEFKTYQSVDKPPKVTERGELQAHLFQIQTKLYAKKRELYKPEAGLELSAINDAWESLEQSEKNRAYALREELLRLEKLNQLAEKFKSKAERRQDWLIEIQQLLSKTSFGEDLQSVRASSKREDAIDTEISAYTTRLDALEAIVQELRAGGYWSQHEIDAESASIKSTWNALAAKQAERRRLLTQATQKHEILSDINEIMLWTDTNEEKLRSDLMGRNVDQVHELLDQHKLLAANIKEGETREATKIAAAIVKFTRNGGDDVKGVTDAQTSMTARITELHALAHAREVALKESLKYREFCQQVSEVEIWIREQLGPATSADLGTGVESVSRLVTRHQALEKETGAFKISAIDQCADNGKALLAAQHSQSKKVSKKMGHVGELWVTLTTGIEQRTAALDNAVRAHEYVADANESESWIKEKEPLAKSTECGIDEQSAEALYQQHAKLDREVNDYQITIDGLRSQCGTIGEIELPQTPVALPIPTTPIAAAPTPVAVAVAAAVAAPSPVVDTRNLVKAAYKYDARKSKELTVAKGDVLEVVNAKNDKWWKVRRTTGNTTEEGYVPATYVKKYKAPPAPLAMDAAPASPAAAVAEKRVKALYKYEARKGKELTIVKGEVLAIVNERDAKWWKVRRTVGDTSQLGYVPVSYVEVLPPVMVVPATPSTPARPETPMSPLAASPLPISRAGSGAQLAVGMVSQQALQQRQRDIDTRFSTLIDNVKARLKMLQDRKNKFRFEEYLAELENWITEKQGIVGSQKHGADVDQVQQLVKQMNMFQQDMGTRELKLDMFNEAAQELIKSGHPDSAQIKALQDALNLQWEQLKEQGGVRDQALQADGELANFNQSVSEICGWINSKLATMPEEIGDDLGQVQRFQRAHAAFDLKGIETEVEKVNSAAEALTATHPEQGPAISQKQIEVESCWNALQAQAGARGTMLEASLQLQQFLSDARLWSGWMEKLTAEIAAVKLAEDVTTAEAHLDRHNLQRAEKDTRAENDIVQQGQAMIDSGHFAAVSVQPKIQDLNAIQAALDAMWTARNLEFEQCLVLRKLEGEAKRIKSVLGTREAFLAHSVAGETVGAVEILLKEHADFEKFVIANGEQVAVFGATVADTIAAGHYDPGTLASLSAEVQAQLDGINARAAVRKAELEALSTWLRFVRRIDGVDAWIKEKMAKASDESYADPSNLNGKLRGHEEFQGVVDNYGDQIAIVLSTGDALVGAQHNEAADIMARSAATREAWDMLLQTSADKGKKLLEAVQEQQFKRNADDLEQFCEQKAREMESQEPVSTKSMAESQVRQHEKLAADVAARRTATPGGVDELGQLAADLVAAGNFRATEILSRKELVTQKYNLLHPAVAARKEKLAADHALQVFLYDAKLENDWILERQPIASSDDLGDRGKKEAVFKEDVFLQPGAKQLQQRHNQFNAEVAGHAHIITSEANAGNALVASGSYDAETCAAIKEQIAQLEEGFVALQAQSTRRAQLLSDNFDSQRMYLDLKQSEAWINEHRALADDANYGNEEETASFVSNHDDLLSKISGEEVIINHLVQSSSNMIAHDHFEKREIEVIQVNLQAEWTALGVSAQNRKMMLDEQLSWHQFSYDFEESKEWIYEMLEIAGSIEVGSDLEACETLSNAFETFKLQVNASESGWLHALRDRADVLVGEAHASAAVITDRIAELDAMWVDLATGIQERSALLVRAEAIHKFNAEAELALQRTEEKNALASDDRCGNSLVEVKNLQGVHRALETDVTALGKDVSGLADVEAQRLSMLYASAETSAEVGAALAPLSAAWAVLQEAMATRTARLDEHFELEQWYSHALDFTAWIEEMTKVCSNERVALSMNVVMVPEAQDLIETHSKRKAEIAAQTGIPSIAVPSAANINDLEGVYSFGSMLVERVQEYSADAATKLSKLQALSARMLEVSESLTIELQHTLGVAKFNALSAEALAWIDKRQNAILDAEEDGLTTDVSSKLEEQDSVERSTYAYAQRITELLELTEAEEADFGPEKIKEYKGQIRSELEESQKKTEAEMLALQARNADREQRMKDQDTELDEQLSKARYEKELAAAEAMKARLAEAEERASIEAMEATAKARELETKLAEAEKRAAQRAEEIVQLNEMRDQQAATAESLRDEYKDLTTNTGSRKLRRSTSIF